MCGMLLFFCVPETFWDRAPAPRNSVVRERRLTFNTNFYAKYIGQDVNQSTVGLPGSRRPSRHPNGASHDPEISEKFEQEGTAVHSESHPQTNTDIVGTLPEKPYVPKLIYGTGHRRSQSEPATKTLKPVIREHEPAIPPEWSAEPPPWNNSNRSPSTSTEESASAAGPATVPGGLGYTSQLRRLPTQSFVQQLRPFNGRLNPDEWKKAAIRPLLLLSYPAVAFASLTYACSVGWLIVISESVAVIYRGEYYHFDALRTGYVYIGPFIGGVLGTAVAGKLSDVVVQFMARRNQGLYEPEFRLVMMLPVAITTGIGLMGFGWSAHDHDAWIVPTLFFSLVSFGCSLGSTTSITFVVDSYRQYAGEALVSLNFCKNILHGLVFSLFVTKWLESDGSKTVYIWIGVMQMVALLLTIPMYIYGKRMRMWTVRQNFMERF